MIVTVILSDVIQHAMSATAAVTYIADYLHINYYMTDCFVLFFCRRYPTEMLLTITDNV